MRSFRRYIFFWLTNVFHVRFAMEQAARVRRVRTAVMILFRMISDFNNRQLAGVIVKLRLGTMEHRAIQLAMNYVAANRNLQQIREMRASTRYLPLVRVMKRYFVPSSAHFILGALKNWHGMSCTSCRQDSLARENSTLRFNMIRIRLNSDLGSAARLWRQNKFRSDVKAHEFKQKAKERLKMNSSSGSQGFFRRGQHHHGDNPR
eukprot:TRINITY_DN4120_c0_g3_i1.p1 TRINITY_DN4120_c0_g3~~TRINITY_DN4120_c0_g3_i1.p1  ORF type:complete len:205 (+),score=26.66 TRINITY_DN4120_c0_g3_i1:241-855(+)